MLHLSQNRRSFAAVRPPGVDQASFDLLVATNHTEAPYPREKAIHRLFEEISTERPDAIALEFGDEKVTYGELNRKSNQLAHYLRNRGVGAEALIAVSFDRSIEMVIALLGILKAGAAYLPLDPEAPLARLEFILNDARSPLILTQEKRVALLPKHTCSVVSLDRDWAQIGLGSDTNLESEPSASSLAYVMFTSGSTGNPKGVMVEHRAITRLVSNTDYVHLDSDEVLLQLAPLAFDASTFEIWGALLNGARLAIMPPQAPTPADIGRVIEQHRVTTLWLTAGLFHQIVEGHLEILRGVHQLLAGGDVLGAPQARRMVSELLGCRLINGYGPTECTTFSCCCTVDALALTAPTIPIGRPIANTRAYILNESGLPVPTGVNGELYIAGDGLARGYLNRPELTTERFVKDPFDSDPTARMYRTGDHVRYLPSGQIEFLGRLDKQVKVRGYRIEIDEITAALLKYPALRSAAVTVKGTTTETKQLAAFVTLREGTSPTSRDLQTFLKETLPDYMVPAHFWVLPALPLTVNGKVNYARLADCRAERLPSGVEYLAPRSGTELTVASVWEDVLGLDRVGVEESFFELGGDSLLLTQMHWKLQQAMGLQFSVTILFQYITVKTLAKYLHDHFSGSESSDKTNQRFGDANSRANMQRSALARLKQFTKGDRKYG